jgi:hypothetical protein
VAGRTGGAESERRLSLPLSPRSRSLRLRSPVIEPDRPFQSSGSPTSFTWKHAQDLDEELCRETAHPVPEYPLLMATLRGSLIDR